MNCPDGVTDILLAILREASLRIRMAGNAGDAEFCGIEADHIHNLPGLIRGFSTERLRSYLRHWRGNYIAALERERPGLNYQVYIPLWERLEQYAGQTPAYNLLEAPGLSPE